MIKIARLLVVHEAYTQRQDAVARYEDRSLSPKAAQEKALSCFALTQSLVRSFMTIAHDGQDPKPVQWIYRSRSYGFKVQYTSTVEGKIQWIGDEILYPQVRFSIVQFRTMIHGLVVEAREQLFKELLAVKLGADQEVDIRQLPPI